MTTDHLGSPRVITDQNGDVTNRKDYTAFGEVNYTAHRAAGLGYAVNAEETRKGYTGYEKDDESGLDFAQARYYNSVHGRFTSIDPLTASMNVRNPQTLNRYSYVLNSPYKYTDPLGLLPYTPMNSGQGCSAEFSSCDKDGFGVDMDDDAKSQYQGTLALHDAQYAFARGNEKRGWQIIEESAGYLQVLDQNGDRAPDPNEPTVTVEATVSSPGVNDHLTIGEEGRNLLIFWEGYEDIPYDNDSNANRNCTVGIGHLLHSGPCGSSSADTRRYSAEEINTFFTNDVANAENIVKSRISVPLTQRQFDALVVLSLNLPNAPKTFAAINNHDWAMAKKEWLSSNKIKDRSGRYVESIGLSNRRNAEWNLFQKGILAQGIIND